MWGGPIGAPRTKHVANTQDTTKSTKHQGAHEDPGGAPKMKRREAEDVRLGSWIHRFAQLGPLLRSRPHGRLGRVPQRAFVGGSLVWGAESQTSQVDVL